MNSKLLFPIIFIFLSCWNLPAVNTNYNFKEISQIKLNKIIDFNGHPGSGQIIEDNIALMFMKKGYDVSSRKEGKTYININNKNQKSVTLHCTITEYTDREIIVIPFRIEDRGSIETVITQSAGSNKNKDNTIATTSTTTTNDGGSIHESGKVEYTQARVGIIIKIIDDISGLLVWSHSYWYNGIELTRTSQICAKNSVQLISKLID